VQQQVESMRASLSASAGDMQEMDQAVTRLDEWFSMQKVHRRNPK
jgi:hypothetical protein